MEIYFNSLQNKTLPFECINKKTHHTYLKNIYIHRIRNIISIPYKIKRYKLIATQNTSPVSLAGCASPSSTSSPLGTGRCSRCRWS